MRPGNRFQLALLALALILAAFFRFWAAPLSAGPDDAQFWAFAKVFQTHGLDFYRYADASAEIFPVKGWGYVYPPVWLLVLRLALFASPASSASDTMVDVSWRIAMKTPIILSDLAIGGLLYWAVPGPKWRKLLFASLWLFNPIAWYESAVFGQFDAIAAALLLASLLLLERGRDRVAFLLAALAAMTKQHAFLAVALMMVIVFRQMKGRRIAVNLAIGAGTAVVLSVPFLVTGNFYAYARSVFLPAQAPDYQFPLMYAFSGSGALITYLHNVFEWDTAGLLRANSPVLAAALVVVAVLCYRKRLAPLQGMLAGILLFTAIFYRVNYQYLVVYIPLALLVASRTRHASERAIALTLALFPSVWLWLFDNSYWFTRYSPASDWVKPVLGRIGLTRLGLPDYTFVSFALVLMSLCLAYVTLLFLRWRHPGEVRVTEQGAGRIPETATLSGR